MMQKNITPAQKAIADFAIQYSRELTLPLSVSEKNYLVRLLAELPASIPEKDQSIWVVTIKMFFAQTVHGDSDIKQLLDGLADQCVDDFMTMAFIIGRQATTYLLRWKNGPVV